PKRGAAAGDDGRLEEIRNGMRDRFGALPPNVENLLRFVRVKKYAQQLGVVSIVREGARAVLKLTQHARVDPNKLLQLIAANPQAKFSPTGVLSFPLKEHGPALIDAIDELLQQVAA